MTQNIIFYSHYSSLQCHMILQELLLIADLVLNKYVLLLLLLSVLNTAYFCGNSGTFSKDSLINEKFIRTAFI